MTGPPTYSITSPRRPLNQPATQRVCLLSNVHGAGAVTGAIQRPSAALPLLLCCKTHCANIARSNGAEPSTASQPHNRSQRSATTKTMQRELRSPYQTRVTKPQLIVQRVLCSLVGVFLFESCLLVPRYPVLSSGAVYRESGVRSMSPTRGHGVK